MVLVILACGPRAECVRSHSDRVWEPDMALNCALTKPPCMPVYYHWANRQVCDEWKPLS
jgi:hypothetical protein